MKKQPKNRWGPADANTMTKEEVKAFNRTAIKMRFYWVLIIIGLQGLIFYYLLSHDPHFELFPTRVSPGRAKVSTEIICEIQDCEYG